MREEYDIPESDKPLGLTPEQEVESQIERLLEDEPPETPAGFIERMAIREALEVYEATAPVKFNPDPAVVDRIVQGIEARERKTGMRLCPCRIARNDPVEDQKIVCPCIYHLEEVERDGHCHCQLFVRR